MRWVPSLFGGATPPLKPLRHAPFAQPSRRDRTALFWWLKRNTSCTAIDHNAKLWDVFAVEWETWLRSQEEPAAEDIQTFKYILDSQICYENGLSGLRKGDRSVFMPGSSEGWLKKKNLGLIRRRLEWYGTPEEMALAQQLPLSMVRSYYVADDAAGALRDSSWYPSAGDPEDDTHYVLDRLPFDTTLPEPQWEVFFSPSQSAPSDGIYEQVDVDGQIVGGMTFFVKGQSPEHEAALQYGPFAWVSTKTPTSEFLWRLLWKDTRYLDGTIPDEEQSFPTPLESVVAAKLAKPVVALPSNLRCEAGEPCPQEGWWFSTAKADSWRRFQAGEVMPTFSSDCGATIWQWGDSQE